MSKINQEEYESEETEVKDIEWAKKEIKGLMTEESQSYPHDKMVEQEVVLGILNQIDQETLSQEWIGKNVEYAYFDTTAGGLSSARAIIKPEKLKDLLVPKQEEPDPETVASVIADFYKSLERLREVLGMEVEELEE